ncbi:MAG: hypothetical protein WC372_11310, partial [Candidatus Neomarinimicrobiota bacterium]
RLAADLLSRRRYNLERNMIDYDHFLEVVIAQAPTIGALLFLVVRLDQRLAELQEMLLKLIDKMYDND